MQMRIIRLIRIRNHSNQIIKFHHRNPMIKSRGYATIQLKGEVMFLFSLSLALVRISLRESPIFGWREFCHWWMGSRSQCPWRHPSPPPSFPPTLSLFSAPQPFRATRQATRKRTHKLLSSVPFTRRIAVSIDLLHILNYQSHTRFSGTNNEFDGTQKRRESFDLTPCPA